MVWQGSTGISLMQKALDHTSGSVSAEVRCFARKPQTMVSTADAHEAIQEKVADRLEDEHAIVWGEQLSDQQLEELLLDPARIYAVLANEVHAQRLEQIPGSLPRYLVQGILPQHTCCM
jgi:hypothetical protein